MDEKLIQLTLPLSSLDTSRRLAGSLRRKEAVKEVLKRALDNCGLSREVIAQELSRLVGEEVSIHTLNNWVAEGKGDRRIPLEYAGALTIITKDVSILNAALDGTGYAALEPKEQPYYKLGKIIAEDRARSKKKRALLEEIGK